MIINKPMEHRDSSKICADCVNKECGTFYWGHSFMDYSEDCERYDCMERMVDVKGQDNG